MNFKKFGFVPADILVPKNIDMQKWSVVACDQYTSQPEYWQETKKNAGSQPSAYNIIFPEIYLESEDNEKKINRINETMYEYLKEDIFEEVKNSFIYVERTVLSKKVRRGLVGAVDLEKYDYAPGSKSLVRATEKTVTERIPARVKIRQNAPLEMPHVMLLADDKHNEIFSRIKKGELLYDFELMQGGGHIRGYKAEPSEEMQKAFESLFEKCDKENALMFAVGDGNHSLAAAKACWDDIKKNLSDEEKKNHPARFGLAELVNIHDESLEFEPIHRIVFDCNPNDVRADMEKKFNISHTPCDGAQKIGFVSDGKVTDMYIKNPDAYLAVGTLQNYIDSHLADKRIDYIHGEDVVKSLAKNNNVGFILPAMDKSELFKTIISDSVLPRKTFSMGEACEKRFYLECRKIK